VKEQARLGRVGQGMVLTGRATRGRAWAVGISRFASCGLARIASCGLARTQYRKKLKCNSACLMFRRTRSAIDMGPNAGLS